jgi:hypothetical protein
MNAAPITPSVEGFGDGREMGAGSAVADEHDLVPVGVSLHLLGEAAGIRSGTCGDAVQAGHQDVEAASQEPRDRLPGSRSHQRAVDQNQEWRV